MNEMRRKYAIFWGCLISSRLVWIEVAARKVFPVIGIEIVDLPFSCCPDPIASKALDHRTWLALAARNLTLAEAEGLDILTLCSGCFETLKMAQHELRDKRIREEINHVLKNIGRQYHEKIHVYHFQDWLHKEYGIERLEKIVKFPLNFRIASHTGCHFSRPADILQTDDPVFPEQLDILSEVLGLDSVDYPDKNLCCGVGVGLVDNQLAKGLVRRKVEGALKARAEMIVAHCPSCIQSFELAQKALVTESGGSFQSLPILHYLELLALAVGIKSTDLAFHEHQISVPKIVLK